MPLKKRCVLSDKVGNGRMKKFSCDMEEKNITCKIGPSKTQILSRPPISSEIPRLNRTSAATRFRLETEEDCANADLQSGQPQSWRLK